MRALIMAAVVLAGLAGNLVRAEEAPPATQPAGKGSQVPVREVVLFSSGVGYFEHFGTVTGNSSTELRFKTAQINDILKSLVLQDIGGKVGTVTYPSQDPIAKTLRSFQIDITNNPPLADILNQVRGATVTALVQTDKVTGTVLGVEKKQKPAGDKGVVEYWVLNLLSGGSIRAISMDDVRDIQLDDPQLQQELHKALAALAQARDQDKKPVVINFTGNGERNVRIGYVVETPVWKTSYRLLMGEKASIQGWAIVENQTDNDWNNVQMSLVSGRPISFVQDLYQPLYIPRPVVKPELYASLAPQTYEGGIAPAAAPAPFGLMGGGGRMARSAMKKSARGGMNGEMSDMAMEAAPMGAMDATASVSSVASAVKVGELFQYTVGNVTLPRQRSAMIPIITDPVEVEKLSIYNQSVLAKNPLNGARLKNTTDKHLLAGPITVLDTGSYAGDASIDNVPPGQERLLSYGIDLEMRVDATKNEETNNIASGKIVKGVLEISNRLVHTQEYLAENKGKVEKTLMVEHPIRHGWKLVDTQKPVESTEVLHRFKGKVAPGQSSKLVVKEELLQGQSMAIAPCDIGQLQFYATSSQIPERVREVLAKAVTLKQAMVETERQMQQRQQNLQQTMADQARTRDNLKAVPGNSESHNRFLKKLNDQDAKIEQLQGQIEELQNKLNGQRKELENYLMNMSVN